MATSLRKWIISITLLLFLVTESGCVGILVTGIIIKKKRDRARAAAEEVKAEQNPATIIPQTVTPVDDSNVVEVPAPKPVPANAVNAPPVTEEKPEVIPAAEPEVSILTKPAATECPLTALQYLGLAFGFVFVTVLAARTIQLIRRS